MTSLRRGSIASTVNGSTGSSASRASSSARRPSSPSHFSRAFGSSAGRAQVAVAAEVALEALRELVGPERADVAAVHPAQLLLVEARRVARDALDAEAADELLGREDRLVVGVAPAEQGDVVAHGLGQVAGVAEVLHRGGAVALGELLAVGAVQQRDVRVDGRHLPERL